MIGFINGTVLFSDGTEVLIQTKYGIGYQVFYNKVALEGADLSLYISHVIREDHQSLYGFSSFQDKKLFEMLKTVKGVGPKSAYSLITALGCDQICNAVALENKKILSSAPGIGAKSAAQMILDLSGKLHKVKMFSSSYSTGNSQTLPTSAGVDISMQNDNSSNDGNHMSASVVIDDAIMACKELGFKEDRILPIIQKIMVNSELGSSEQLVHLVLKEV